MEAVDGLGVGDGAVDEGGVAEVAVAEGLNETLVAGLGVVPAVGAAQPAATAVRAASTVRRESGAGAITAGE